MQNVNLKVEGKKLIIVIDLDRDLGPSKSGKTLLVATTAGNVTVPGTDVKLGLNAYKGRD